MSRLTNDIPGWAIKWIGVIAVVSGLWIQDLLTDGEGLVDLWEGLLFLISALVPILAIAGGLLAVWVIVSEAISRFRAS